MASVTLSESNGYRLVHPDQDWRGWDVRDGDGNVIGRVTDFIIDTEESRAVSLVLDNRTEVPLDDADVEDGYLKLRSRAAASGGDPPSWPLFEEATLDVLERVEAAQMRKRPVVIEELVINHDVADRKAHIQTTLRRFEVDVEPLPASTRIPN